MGSEFSFRRKVVMAALITRRSNAAHAEEVRVEGSVRQVKLSLGKAHTRKRRKAAWVVKRG